MRLDREAGGGTGGKRFLDEPTAAAKPSRRGHKWEVFCAEHHALATGVV